ncbi:MAG: hypothetical protein K1X88_35510, partial [Nannocystaceae bacterium]|nr:hypothetical protein [Nannocystaceae bacterium]
MAATTLVLFLALAPAPDAATPRPSDASAVPPSFAVPPAVAPTAGDAAAQASPASTAAPTGT